MAMDIIGIMTGNSLDAVDVVLTRFENTSIKDIASYSLEYPVKMREQFLKLRENIKSYAVMEEALKDELFKMTVDEYTKLVAQAVNKLITKYDIKKDTITAIGFHGQTCDHLPPSISGSQQPYTLQVGNAELLAQLTDIPVIYDFRSDDIMNGGEGAPLAPMHNFRLARTNPKFSDCTIAFCNGGNTGNLAIVSSQQNVTGWDVGPFNHLPDYLMRHYQNLPFDSDGAFGKKGKVQPRLLQYLFDNIALTTDKGNFYKIFPPKSSDPHWYKNLYDNNYSFADNLRTAEYLSAYGFLYNLSFLKNMPKYFLLFGGGWKNPIIKQDFIDLLKGKGKILPEHQAVFDKIKAELPQNIEVNFSDAFGFSGGYMEARIFADMAYCKILNIPFSTPQITGCKKETVGGIYVLPSNKKEYLLTQKLKQYHNSAQPVKNPQLWSRATKGWQSTSTSC